MELKLLKNAIMPANTVFRNVHSALPYSLATIRV